MITTLSKEKFLNCGLCELYDSNTLVPIGCQHYDHDTGLYICTDCARHLYLAEMMLGCYQMHDPCKSKNIPKGRGLDILPPTQ